jgi:hypothetical protein
MFRSFNKVALVVLVFCGLSVQSVFAQPGMDPEARIKEMITSLEVTAEQEPKFREVMNDYYGKIQSSMSQAGGDRAGMMAKIQELQGEQEKNLSGILNETQMAKYKEQQAARRARMGQ